MKMINWRLLQVAVERPKHFLVAFSIPIKEIPSFYIGVGARDFPRFHTSLDHNLVNYQVSLAERVTLRPDSLRPDP